MNKASIGIFLIIGMSLVIPSFGQTKLETGYIITFDGDTLEGFIDNQNKERNPVTVSFRTEINGQSVSYSPIEIKGFKLPNEVYESAIVTIDDVPTKDSELTFSNENHPRADTIFLRMLYDGEKSLFYYMDEKRREHFFIRQGSGFERLVYKKYLVRVDGDKKIKTDKTYLNQLSLYLQKCPSVHDKLSHIQYNSKGLTDLFQHYYECTRSRVSYQEAKEKIKAEYGIVAGLTSTRLSFYSEDYDYLTNVDFARSTDFSAGLFLNLVLPRNHKKWSIYNEVLFSSYKFNGEHHEVSTTSADITTNTNTILEYSYIKLNNMLRFKFPLHSMFFYLNAGLSNGLVVKETNAMERISKVYSKESIQHKKAIDYSTKLEQGLILGLGSQFNKYSFDARYEVGNGMSGVVGLGSVVSRFHFLLGYRL